MKVVKATKKLSLRRLIRDEEGSTLAMAAAGTMAAMGFAALAVDAAHFYVLKNQLQTTADAAVLAAISQLPDAQNARSVAQGIATQNLPSEIHGNTLLNADIVLGGFDSSTRTFTAGINPATAVQVTLRRAEANGNPARTFFGQALGITDVDIVAQSVAGQGRGPICLMALEPSEIGILVNSNSSITANGCVIQVNSEHTTAIRTNSVSSVTADDTNVVGDYSGPGYTPTPDTGMPSLPDPLADLQPPPTADDPCDYIEVTVNSANTTLYPGVYCAGLTINSNSSAILEPGIYVFRDGKLEVNSNSSISGEGVGFYFTGPGAVSILNSNSIAVLSAPVSGPMAGIVMFQDRDMPPGSENVLNSNTGSVIEGTSYFPNGNVVINSNSTLGQTSPNSSLIARTIAVNSNSHLVLNSDYKASQVPLPKGLAKRNNALLQ
jgi:hypothetical protein